METTLSPVRRRPQSLTDPSTTVVRLCADPAVARRIAEVMSELLDPSQTAVGTFDGPGDKWTVEASFGTTPDRALVRKLVEQVAGKRAGRALAFETLSNPDWVQSSLAGLRPVEAGRFVVHGRHDRHRIAPNRVGVEIEAALAFGTGHHGTTRGCLLALDRIVKEGKKRRAPPACRLRGSPRAILDIGTGTGVLAIAAARTLRRRAMASDIDPVAVRVARANVRLNGALAMI